MAQLFIHSFSSHIFSQGMGCAFVATVSAGTAGQGTPAKSGWGQSTEEERTVVLEAGSLAARSDQSTGHGRHQAGTTPQEIHRRREKTTATTQHSFFYCTGYKLSWVS